MTPSCEQQDCGYRICCFYCEVKKGCSIVCSNIDRYIKENTDPIKAECTAFVDDDN